MKASKILFHTTTASILLCLLSLFSSQTFAMSTNGNFYLGGNVGASRISFKNNNPEINYYDDLLNDTYNNNSNNATAAIFGLQGGYEFMAACSKPALALGLGVYGSTSYKFTGQVIETALGDLSSPLYRFTFHTSNIRLMAEGQLMWNVNHFLPFIDVGLGSAWIKMNKYTEVSNDGIGYPPLPRFHTRTNINCAYQAGLGIGYEHINQRITLGYRYVDLGNTSFGTRGAVYPYKLNFGRLTSNEIYLGLTHLF